MADAARSTIVLRAGIPGRSAGVASGTGKTKGRDFPPFFYFSSFDLLRNTKPRLKRGFAVINRALSKRTAATVAPEEAAGADPLAAYHDDLGPLDDDRRSLDHNARALNHDDLAIGTAEALAVAMESGTASIGRIRGTKACEGADNQSRCEKVFHVFSLDGRDAAGDDHKSIRHVRYLRRAERRKP
jgi:hypothetical protein